MDGIAGQLCEEIMEVIHPRGRQGINVLVSSNPGIMTYFVEDIWSRPLPYSTAMAKAPMVEDGTVLVRGNFWRQALGENSRASSTVPLVWSMK